MPLSELPPPVGTTPNATIGQEAPLIRIPPPGPMSRSWANRHDRVACPSVFSSSSDPQAGDASRPIVYASAIGANVFDVDGNRYVDLAAGFGSILLGHNAEFPARSMEMQCQRTWTGLGDVYPADAKIAMLERVTSLYPEGKARALLCQSGSDAVTAAIKTAVLHTQRPGIIAFNGAYHGMGYAALAACGYRDTFRIPFSQQLNQHISFAPYPHQPADLEASLTAVRQALEKGNVAGIIVEPVLGRGGCIDPPPDFLPALSRLAFDAGATLIADEIWTGLGRSGALLACSRVGVVPDIICLGKGLGGGLPISACVARDAVMQAWAKHPGVLHTSTFQGNALACSTGVATIDTLRVQKLCERAAHVGDAFRTWLNCELKPLPAFIRTTGAGLMVGVELESGSIAARARHSLLQQGYIVLTGGSEGQSLTLTPPLTIHEDLLKGFVDVLAAVLRENYL
ncbi:MAG: aspartate aminotransferase family protein [Sorangium cellulosum]|nr:MAG: aspartate aminotransferase family protein [Sorangium cellulosum]